MEIPDDSAETREDSAEYRKGWEDGLDRAASEMRDRSLYDAEAIINDVPRVPPPLSVEGRLMLKELEVVSTRRQLVKLEWEAVALRGKVRAATTESWTRAAEQSDFQAVALLSREQREAATAWSKRHDADKCHPADGEPRVICGVYTWLLTETPLGFVAKYCCACGDAIDVSYYTFG
jgi:hypothetical protein